MQKSKKTKNVNEKSIRKIDFLFHFLVLRSFIKQMNYHDDGHIFSNNPIDKTFLSKDENHLKQAIHSFFLIDWFEKKFINLLSVWICLKIPKKTKQKNLILSKQTKQTKLKVFISEILNIDYFLSVCFVLLTLLFSLPFDSHPSIHQSLFLSRFNHGFLFL